MKESKHRQDRVQPEDWLDWQRRSRATSQGLAGASSSTDGPKATSTTPLASKDTW